MKERKFDIRRTVRSVERLLIEISRNGYCMFINDGTVQFFKGINPPRNKRGEVIADEAIYNCDTQISADGGATL